MGIEMSGSIDQARLPKHIAIIMDGNGRWAKKRFLPRSVGHKYGMDRVVSTVQFCSDLGIKHLSLYAFSTENWKRPPIEINALMDLLVIYVETQLVALQKNNVKINILGDITALIPKAEQALLKAMEETKENTGLVLNLAINYGGRDEIMRAFHDYMSNHHEKSLSEASFQDYLDTKGQPDPDLLIRPGGEKRISNFMIYQCAYTELYFSDVLWPDFDENEMSKAINEFQQRDRRFGDVK